MKHRRSAPFVLVSLLVAPLASQAVRAPALAWDAQLRFEPNLGQLPDDARFAARGPNYAVLVSSDRLELGLQNASGERAALTMRLCGAHPHAALEGADRLTGVSHYYRGRDPERWITGVPHFARVVGRDVLPGVDVVYRGDARQLEYDFVVGPGADPSAIRIAIDGARRIDIDTAGNLAIVVEGGRVVQRAPVLFQRGEDGRRRPVAGRFRLEPDRVVAFEVGRYDPSRPLVIDPAVVYSSYFGAGTDAALHAIAAAGDGTVYCAGGISSGMLPAAAGTPGGGSDAFVSRFDAAGNLLYSAYFGGSGDDYAAGIALDGSGWAWITGTTGSSDLPASSGAYDTSFGGESDVLVAGFEPTGLLGYATYLGGPANEGGRAIACGPGGTVYVTGSTSDSGASFPTTPGAFSSSNVSIAAGLSDVFVAKLAPTGAGAADLAYATLIGGGGSDAASSIAVDAAGDVSITGQTFTEPSRQPYWPTTSDAYRPTIRAKRNWLLDTAYVTKLAPNGNGTSDLVYSTFLFPTQGSERGSGIAADDHGRVYVCGLCGDGLETTPGAFDPDFNGGHQISYVDSFVIVLDTTLAGGAGLVYSTYLGGFFTDSARAISATGATAGAPGTLHVAGYTEWGTAPSNETAPVLPFPTTADAIQGSHSGRLDGFYTRLAPSGNGAADLEYSTLLGGSGDNDSADAIAIGPGGIVHLVGSTDSNDFLAPFTSGVQASAWIAALDVGAPAPPPAAPTDLTAQAISSSRIDLAWTDNADDEGGFHIERSPDGSSWTLLATTGPNVVAYPDSGLPPSTTWSYRVRAFGGGGVSAWSNVASATTQSGGGGDALADGEYTTEGSVVGGSFVDTQATGGGVESIVEGESNGKPSKRFSTLEHVWTFQASAGTELEVHASCTAEGDGDEFEFDWSTDGSSYHAFASPLEVSPSSPFAQVAPFGQTVDGTVYVRVRDTDSTPGTRGLKDTLSVDFLVVH